MIIAHISDTHVQPAGQLLFGKIDTNAALETAVNHLNAMQPPADMVLVTGDIVNDGTAAEYVEAARQLGRVNAPVFPIPGNHDSRPALRQAFPQMAFLQNGPFMQYTVEDHPVRVVALDTVVEGAPHGALCADRLGWLDAALSNAPDRPTIVMMHHPPVETGIDHMDAMRCLEGADELGEIVARNPQIERILCGHLHRPIHLRWRGTVVSTMPGAAHQVSFELRPGVAGSWRYDPPAVQVHLWRDGLGLISHLDFPGDYGPARAFGHD